MDTVFLRDLSLLMKVDWAILLSSSNTLDLRRPRYDDSVQVNLQSSPRSGPRKKSVLVRVHLVIRKNPSWPGRTVMMAAQSEDLSLMQSEVIRMHKTFELRVQVVQMEETNLHVDPLP